MKSKKKPKRFVEDRAKVCFSELGVKAKKAFYFHDQPWMTPLLLAMHALCLADAKRRADNLGPVKTALVGALALPVADLWSGLYHCYGVDRRMGRHYVRFALPGAHPENEKEVTIDHKNRQMVVCSTEGYYTPHHILPSNSKDIQDFNIFRDESFVCYPFLLLALLNLHDESALLLHLVYELSCVTNIIHKYAHERRHGRHVPPILRLLQDCKLCLDPNFHGTHHEKLDSHFNLLNGWTHDLTNTVIGHIDRTFGLRDWDLEIAVAKRFAKRYGTDIIPVKFTGDLDGVVFFRLRDNLLVPLRERKERRKKKEGGQKR